MRLSALRGLEARYDGPVPVHLLRGAGLLPDPAAGLARARDRRALRLVRAIARTRPVDEAAAGRLAADLAAFCTGCLRTG